VRGAPSNCARISFNQPAAAAAFSGYDAADSAAYTHENAKLLRTVRRFIYVAPERAELNGELLSNVAGDKLKYTFLRSASARTWISAPCCSPPRQRLRHAALLRTNGI